MRTPLLLFTAVGAVAAMVYGGVQLAAFYKASAAPYPIAAVPPGSPQINIFFVGNSYTSENDLPRLLRAIAADAQNPVDVETVEAAAGGVRLVDSWGNGQARAALFSRHWDYVVLQEQSLMTMLSGNQPVIRSGFFEWGQSIHAAGAMPVVFETWARQPGSAAYSSADATANNLTDATTMQAQIDYVLGEAGSSIGALPVPVGDVWMRCEQQPGAPLLYESDNSHPSLAGSYLAAMLFYRILIGHTPSSSNFVPDGLDPAAAQILRGCAS